LLLILPVLAAKLNPAGKWSITGKLHTGYNDHPSSNRPMVLSDKWTVKAKGNDLDMTSNRLKGQHIKGKITETSNGGYYAGAVDFNMVVAGVPCPTHMTYQIDVHMKNKNELYAGEIIRYYGYRGNNVAMGMNPVPASETWKIVGKRIK
jgi:hypothetical protein